MANQPLVVLVVGKPPELSDRYATWVRERHTTLTAYSVSEALELLDENIDVVLLDQQIVDATDVAILTDIDDRGLSCLVGTLTSINRPAPDLDGRLSTAAPREELLELVNALGTRKRYEPNLTELFSLLSAQCTLEAKLSDLERQRSETYRELTDRIHTLETEETNCVGGLSAEHTKALFRQVIDSAGMDTKF